MKNKIKIYLFSLAILGNVILPTIPVHAADSNNSTATYTVASSKYTNQLRAEIIEWRYKVINNKLYKRLYNYTRQEWVGSWKLV